MQRGQIVENVKYAAQTPTLLDGIFNTVLFALAGLVELIAQIWGEEQPSR